MLLVFLCLIGIQAQVLGQNQAYIDSLKKRLKNSKSDTHQIRYLWQLGECYLKSDPDQAKQYMSQGLALSHGLNYLKGLFNHFRLLGKLYYQRGKYNKARQYYTQLYNKAVAAKKPEVMAHALALLSDVYTQRGLHSKAISTCMQALKLAERVKNPLIKAQIFNRLGITYRHQGAYDNAAKNYEKALLIHQQLNDLPGVSKITLNLGSIYLYDHQYPKAIQYYFKALRMKQQLGEKAGIARAMSNIGHAYYYQRKYILADQYLKKALELRLQLKNKGGVAITLRNLGKLYLAWGKSQQAKIYLNESKATAQKTRKRNLLKELYLLLSKVDSAQGNFSVSLEWHKKHTKLKDSIFSLKKSKQIIEMQTLYDTEAQEKENDLLKKEQALQKIEIKQKNTQLFASVAASIMSLVAMLFFYHQRRQKQKINHQLQELNQQVLVKNQSLLQKQEEIITQHDAIEQQNTLLKQQNHYISQSIKSAKTIQQAMLPFEERLQAVLNEYFIIYQPKDIVSGDFYWLGQVGNLRIIAAVDCTGHGVPGAFMSMMSFSLLNEVVQTRKITSPAIILEKLNAMIRYALKQDKTKNNSGLDAAFITLEGQKKQQTQVTFAGAKRPLWYIRPESGLLEEVKGSSISIGVQYKNKREFTQHDFKLNVGARLYLSTDGFADQNDSKRKKIGATKLKKIIEDISHHPMEAQKKHLMEFLQQHMQGTSQRDDILLMGIKID